LSTPISVAPTSAATSATTTPRSASTAAIAAAMAIVDPTDRSTPRVAITNVMPTAASTTVDTCNSTFHRLPVVAKFGVNITFTSTRTTSVPSAAYSGPTIHRTRPAARCAPSACRPFDAEVTLSTLPSRE
jgi:hypothetical protein